MTMPPTDLDTLHALAIGKIQINQLPGGPDPASQQQANMSMLASPSPAPASNGSDVSTSSQAGLATATTTYQLTQPVARLLLSLGLLTKGDLPLLLHRSAGSLWYGVFTPDVSQ
jgi:hypothetical protein